MFHNDPYLPALGESILMLWVLQPGVMWAEIWGQLGDVIEGVVNEGEHLYAEDLQILIN